MQRVLVLGDFMIDVWYVVTYASLTSQFHAGIPAQRRARPEIPNERPGAAAIVADGVQRFSGLEVVGLGCWNPVDDVRWANFGISTQDAPPRDRFRLVRLETPEPQITTLKLRVWHYNGPEKPTLLGRVDQDPIELPTRTYLSSIGRKHVDSDVAAVIVSDFNKGAVTNYLLAEVKKQVRPETPWLVSSKNRDFLSLFRDIAIDTLFLNRKEAVDQARALGSPVKGIPPGPYVTDELLAVAEHLCDHLNLRMVIITLGPDGAATAWRDKSSKHIYFCYCGPSDKPPDYSGVSAGDVFMGRWVADYLSTSALDPPDRLKRACDAAHGWCQYQDRDVWSQRRTDAPDVKDAPESGTGFSWQAQASERMAGIKRTLLNQRKYPQLLNPQLKLSHARRYLGDFLTVNESLGAQIVDIKTDLELYRRDRNAKDPYVSLLVAAPGSGKTFLSEQLAANTGFRLVTANITTLASYAELIMLFDQMASDALTGDLPLLVLDECDTMLEGERIFARLLSPLLDGKYQVGLHQRRLGRIAILMIASECPTLAEFGEWLKSQIKGRDLLSRINGRKIQLDLPNQSDRVYTAASRILRNHPTVTQVQQGVLDLFAKAEGLTQREISQMVSALRAQGEKVLNKDNIESIWERFPKMRPKSRRAPAERLVDIER